MHAHKKENHLTIGRRMAIIIVTRMRENEGGFQHEYFHPSERSAQGKYQRSDR